MFVHSDIYDKIRNVDRTYSLLPVTCYLLPITYYLFLVPYFKSRRKNSFFYIKKAVARIDIIVYFCSSFSKTKRSKQ